jgi:lipoate-protein ligase A
MSTWMLWRTDKCVMLGGNQIANAEIDIHAADEAGACIVRRSSGGGTIFTDLGTLQYTVIVPFSTGDDVKQLTQTHLAEPMIRALRAIGVPALLEGRNDITLGGAKISGMAQYVRNARLCMHGSLLYDTDLDTLIKVLRPDEEKIKTKALRSQRSRVTTIAQYLGGTVSFTDFRQYLKQELFRSLDMREYRLTSDEARNVEAIRVEKYDNSEWTYGKTPRFSYHNQKRFPMGKAEVFLDTEKGIISSCKINGDFLGVMPIRELEAKIEGTPYRYQAVDAILADLDLRLYLGGVTREELLSCMF